MYALRSKRAYIERSAKGVAQKGIYLGEVADIDLPVPSVKQQATIIDKLDKTNGVIQKRQQQLQAFDTLIKARFVEMFGDPVSNPRGWKTLPWASVFDTKTGKLDSNASVEGGEYPFFTCAKEWLWIDQYAYDCEALLLAGNNAAGIYDVKHYKGKFNAYQRTYILQLKSGDWTYSLFKYQLEDRLQYLQSQSKGTNTRYLTMGILSSLDFIIPPKMLQDEFATFVSETEKSKFLVQQALDETQLLFDSLMQKYFG
jgi:restriction endonuclease S subunit